MPAEERNPMPELRGRNERRRVAAATPSTQLLRYCARDDYRPLQLRATSDA